VKYKIKRSDRAAETCQVGQIVYSGPYDYGCASTDTLATGIEHISVTPTGTYPTFTIPKEDLEPIPE
jgi:hypothetical protein